MMFLSLVKQQDIDFSFIKFIKYGFVGIILSIFSFALIMIF
jgi:Na+/H+ antiporter NhaD/arsenite permease-like protein